jgi:hypothetical protein
VKVKVTGKGGVEFTYDAPFIQLERDPNDGSYTLNLHDDELEPTGFVCYAKDSWLLVELLELPAQHVRDTVNRRREEHEQQAHIGTGMHI